MEVPDQVVGVGDDALVKVIDIDLERRRISLSLKQANEDYNAEFDPSKYGMADSYDEQGNYIFPEGFDPETNEWLEGFDKQREEWESRYAEAERRHKMHTAQMEKMAADEAAEAAAGASGTNYSSESGSDEGAAASTESAVARWRATHSSLHCARSCRATPDSAGLSIQADRPEDPDPDSQVGVFCLSVPTFVRPPLRVLRTYRADTPAPARDKCAKRGSGEGGGNRAGMTGETTVARSRRGSGHSACPVRVVSPPRQAPIGWAWSPCAS